MATEVVFNRLVCQCDICGHAWIVKPKHSEENKPRDCPRCRSVKWDMPSLEDRVLHKGGDGGGTK